MIGSIMNIMFLVKKIYNTITDVNRLNPTNRITTSIYLCWLNFTVGFHECNRGRFEYRPTIKKE